MDRNETILKNFLCEKIDKTGGSAQIKYLSQLLSNLSYDVRNSVANNQGELMRFLRKHPEIFQIDANGNVRLQNPDLFQVDDDQSVKRFEKREPHDDLPKQVKNGEGVVIKIHPTFGFIAAKSPFKTTVYFSPNSFGDDQLTLLTDIDKLHVGAKVGFHASKGGNERSSSKYRAYRVWLLKSENEENKTKLQNNCEPNVRKTRETGKFDAGTNEGEGKIQKLMQNYGFIIIDDDRNNTVFFYKSQLVKYENVVDLNKVLKVGDLVEFKAVRTGQKNIQARWSATQVWVKKSAKIKPNSKDNTNFERSTTKKQYLQNQTGKIYPHSKGIVIKFGPKDENIADADSSVFYMLGTKVSDVSWEFSDGDNVHFDAIEIKSAPGWKATLVWTGKRPDIVLPPDLGDFSEFADDFDDTASTVSKISDVSENSYRSYRPPPSRSSGYSSMMHSQEDLHFRIPPNRAPSIETRSYIDMNVEDISDVTSCYSRSSDKSGGSSRGGFPPPPKVFGSSRSSRGHRRRSANNKKKFSNQDLRQDDVNDSVNSYNEKLQGNGNRNLNTYHEKRQESLNRNSNAYHENRSESLNRNSNAYHENRPESLNRNSWVSDRMQENVSRNSSLHKEKRQESLNRDSNSYRGRRWENMNKGSNSNRERRQGSINRSSSSYQERRQDANKRSSSVGKQSRFRENERFKRHEEFLNKYLDDSPDEEVDDNNSTISESSKDGASCKEVAEPETKTYINWADTPYPGEDDDLEVGYNPKKVDLKTEKCVVQESVKESVDDNQDDVYNSEDEFSDAVEEREESLPLDDQIEQHELLTTNDDSLSDTKEEKEDTPKCSIKIFKEIEGTIKSVRCKYGQIISPLLPMPANFFWHDVYHKEVPVSERYDDLREILNVGEVLKFNCISVIDDEEHNFIKCTLLWKGKKPNIDEMTPQQYIENENLQVSLKEDSYEIEVISPNNTIPAVVPSDQPKRKFLVTVNSEDKGDSDSDAEVSASAAKPLPSSSVQNEVLNANLTSEESESETETHSDKDELIEGISKIIKYGGLPASSQFDLSSVSAEILNFVMNMSAVKKLHTVTQSTKETQTEVDYDVPKPPEPIFIRSDGTEVTNSETQTIFTGDVVGISILPQC